jgi:hypothetical protein
MVQGWSNWKSFPNAGAGGLVEAPIGPGVYEVRHTDSGEQIAFGHAGNVAEALADLKVDDGGASWSRMFRKTNPVPLVGDLEYRTCAAASRAEARTAARRLKGLRQSYWRRRMELGWAARHSR